MFRSMARSRTVGCLGLLFTISMMTLMVLPSLSAEDVASSTLFGEPTIGMVENSDDWLATLIGGSIMLICGIIILIIFIMAIKKVQMKGRLDR